VAGLTLVKKRLLDLLSTSVAASRGLRLRPFDVWKPELDEVLRGLPEGDSCPHELFTMLCTNPGPTEKKLILVEERGEPIALACFRDIGEYCVPVTHYIVPGFLFPVKEGCIEKVLGCIGFTTQVAWWRFRNPPPHKGWVRNIKEMPTYGMRCSENFEEFWSKTSLLRNVRNTRRRCEGFTLRVNVPDVTEWIVRSWGEKWRPPGATEMVDLRDRILAATYLLKHGSYYSLALFDGTQIAAGGNLIVHRNEVVAQYNYRNPQYDKQGVMTRHIDMTFAWAREMGFEGLDLGGSQDYKTRWAPENGKKWEFVTHPPSAVLVGKARKTVAAARGLLLGRKVGRDDGLP
jgi:hypothetical protein